MILIDMTPIFSQWIGIDDCRKPIKNGPSLAGLPGGLAGDLMRLYPIQTNDMYPLKVSFQYKLLHHNNLRYITEYGHSCQSIACGAPLQL